jgi:hypothetical protein
MEIPPKIKEELVGFLPTNFLVYSRLISWDFNNIGRLHERRILQNHGLNGKNCLVAAGAICLFFMSQGLAFKRS